MNKRTRTLLNDAVRTLTISSPCRFLSALPLSGQGERIEQGSVPHTTLADKPSASPDKSRKSLGFLHRSIYRICRPKRSANDDRCMDPRGRGDESGENCEKLGGPFLEGIIR